MFAKKKLSIPTPDQSLPGRKARTFAVPKTHFVNGNRMLEPWPAGLEEVTFGMGCFWGAERKFWQVEGVYSTQAGYIAGHTNHPTYREVCSGQTGHNEVVRVVFDPAKVSFDALLKVFWESHDPTQGMRQGNDVGTQYRSGIYVASAAHKEAAEASKQGYQAALNPVGYCGISTEILDAPEFFYAEE
ncbi:MAG: peptide-methionine (S)-S-oxide reductase, partial [Bradymonadia bacterium]